MLCLTDIGQIRLTRGDTLILPIEINQGTKLRPIAYELNEHDEVYFGLMEPNQSWEQSILRKKYTAQDMINGKLYLEFKPSDTMCLLPGMYYYQLKVRVYNEITGTYIVNTIIPKTHFWIEE